MMPEHLKCHTVIYILLHQTLVTMLRKTSFSMGKNILSSGKEVLHELRSMVVTLQISEPNVF